ncbi:MAG: EamA family transporter [Pseudomonadota bacterium]
MQDSEAVLVSWRPVIAGGVISLVACWFIIWAMTHAPMTMVSAVRETGMIFAVLIGVFVLKERLGLNRWASISTTFIRTLFSQALTVSRRPAPVVARLLSPHSRRASSASPLSNVARES